LPGQQVCVGNAKRVRCNHGASPNSLGDTI
jgi:hypothetical protein